MSTLRVGPCLRWRLPSFHHRHQELCTRLQNCWHSLLVRLLNLNTHTHTHKLTHCLTHTHTHTHSGTRTSYYTHTHTHTHPSPSVTCAYCARMASFRALSSRDSSIRILTVAFCCSRICASHAPSTASRSVGGATRRGQGGDPGATQRHTHTHTQTQVHMHTHPHQHTCTPTHPPKHRFTCTCTHMHTHADTHTHAHTRKAFQAEYTNKPTILHLCWVGHWDQDPPLVEQNFRANLNTNLLHLRIQNLDVNFPCSPQIHSRNTF